MKLKLNEPTVLQGDDKALMQATFDRVRALPNVWDRVALSLWAAETLQHHYGVHRKERMLSCPWRIFMAGLSAHVDDDGSLYLIYEPEPFFFQVPAGEWTYHGMEN